MPAPVSATSRFTCKVNFKQLAIFCSELHPVPVSLTLRVVLLMEEPKAVVSHWGIVDVLPDHSLRAIALPFYDASAVSRGGHASTGLTSDPSAVSSNAM